MQVPTKYELVVNLKRQCARLIARPRRRGDRMMGWMAPYGINVPSSIAIYDRVSLRGLIRELGGSLIEHIIVPGGGLGHPGAEASLVSSGSHSN